MAFQTSRRSFLQTSAAVGVGYWVTGQLRAEDAPKSPNERIRFACIGMGGKGGSDSADAGRSGDVVAICDVDQGTLDKAADKFPGAKKYTDFRKMFDEMAKEIDAFTVSTPDHTHAPAGIIGMSLGKHCFCQKPMTHSIEEARLMGQLAKKNKLATQMGNQGTANSSLREAAALVRSGILGTVKEVHVWTNRPIWPQGLDRPTDTPSTPESLNWEAWIGPRPMRPYHPAYHPFKWRGWWDFGTGALGDMACHTLNMPFMALELRDPISVQAECPEHNKETYPKLSVITYEFPALKASEESSKWPVTPFAGERPPVKMVWYDGGKRPPAELFGGNKIESSGCLVVGDKGTLYAPGDYAERGIITINCDKVPVEYERSPGHFQEWVRAIRGEGYAASNFENYATPLTETVLLGNLAVWTPGKKVEWNAEKLEAKNAPEAEEIIRHTYRAGWDIHKFI